MSNVADINGKAKLQDQLCPLKHTLEIIGGKWKLPIICMLASGTPTRYSSIKRKLTGITNMMLSSSLKELEAKGMIHREQYNEIPPRVEYYLTDLGTSILPALLELAKWGTQNMQETSATPDVFCDICSAIK